MSLALRKSGRGVPGSVLGVLLLVAAVLLASCSKPTTSAPPAPKVVEEDLTAKLKTAQAEVVALEQTATAEYSALDARRAKLTGAAPADVEAFNRDAEQYKNTSETLQRRQEELKTLVIAEVKYREIVAQREKPAVDLLNRLRDAIDTNNWSAQLNLLQEALSRYQATKTFAQISALAKPQFARVSPAEIERSLASRPVVSEAQTVTNEIQAIVNQTPTVLPAKVGTTTWIGFHAGAMKPNFRSITLDELKRGRQFYTVDSTSMDGAPTVFYVARETEFNPMTKFFYTDRTKAKKRLSDAEYDRLLVLYHRLGEIEGQPALSPTAAAAETWAKWEALKKSWP
jgi:hypothetical protein